MTRLRGLTYAWATWRHVPAVLGNLQLQRFHIRMDLWRSSNWTYNERRYRTHRRALPLSYSPRLLSKLVC